MPDPPYLAPLEAEERWRHSELLPDGLAPPLSEGEPGHPAEEAHLACLYPPSFYSLISPPNTPPYEVIRKEGTSEFRHSNSYAGHAPSGPAPSGPAPSSAVSTPS